MPNIKRSRIDYLTKAEKTQMKPWADKWIDIGLRTGEMDWEASEEAIARCYTFAGLAKPRFIRSTSPLATVIAGPTEAETLDGVSVSGTLTRVGRGSAYDSVRDSVARAVETQVMGEVSYSVSDSVSDSVTIAVGVSARSHFVSGLVRNAWPDYLGGQFWPGAASYLSFFTDVLGLDCGGDFIAKANAWCDMVRTSCWLWPGDGFVIVSPYPLHLKRDAEGRLHSETGKAVEWVDSFGVSAWHGIKIPDEWLTDKEVLTSTVALQQHNVEQRRCAAEILGWDKVLKDPSLSPVIINENTNKQIGKLIRVDLPNSPREQFLIARCGTGRTFALPVPPDVKTAHQANAWTYGLDDISDLEVRT